MVEQLRGIDAAFLELESASGHMQGVGVVRLVAGEEHLALEDLVSLVARRLPRLGLLHRRLVTVPGGLDRPYWIDSPPDLSMHIHRHQLEEPGAFEAFCAGLAGTKLDRSAPMWQFWLVDGLEDGAQALVIKVHHSLSDGVGSLALVAQIFDLDRDAGDDDAGTVGPGTREEAPEAPWLLARAAMNALVRPVTAAITTYELLASAFRLRKVVAEPGGSGFAAPLATPHLAFHGPITAARSVALRDLPLDRVKAVAHAAGVHVNDVVLAVVAGTLRRWLVVHDDLPEQPLVAAVPVSTRTPEQLLAPGNYVSACFVHLPVQLEDVRERLERTAAVASDGKSAHAAVGGRTLERLTSLVFPVLLSVPMELYHRLSGASAHPSPVNVVVSDVAGPTFDLFLAGRRAEAFYALGPIFDGVALNVTAISFEGVLGFGWVTCPDSVADLDLLADGQAAAFEELADAYGV